MFNLMIDSKSTKDYCDMTMKELNDEKYRIIKCLTLSYKMRDTAFSKECDKELHYILKEIKRRKNSQ